MAQRLMLPHDRERAAHRAPSPPAPVPARKGTPCERGHRRAFVDTPPSATGIR